MIYREWSPELIAELEAPFPAIDHKTKRQGGQEITFVDVHKYKERLNALVGPQGWSCFVRLEAFGGKLVATTAVTILGVTKENVGDEVEVPEVNERGNEKIIGASCTNSYAQAFKRTCSDFGLGAYLYNEGKRNAAKSGVATGQRVVTPSHVAAVLRKLAMQTDPTTAAEVEKKIAAGLTAPQASALKQDLTAKLALTGATT